MSRGHFGAGRVANVVMCPFQLQLRDLFYFFSHGSHHYKYCLMGGKEREDK